MWKGAEGGDCVVCGQNKPGTGTAELLQEDQRRRMEEGGGLLTLCAWLSAMKYQRIHRELNEKKPCVFMKMKHLYICTVLHWNHCAVTKKQDL